MARDLRKETKKEPKKDMKVPEDTKLLETKPRLNRCTHATCRECRKHNSCLVTPRLDGGCAGFEEGPAWDHTCKPLKNLDY